MQTDNQNIKYKTQKITTLKLKKESTIAKMKADGWELIDQLDGKLRCTLSFRKPVKPLNMKLVIPSVIGIVTLIAAVAIFSPSEKDQITSSATSSSSSSESSRPTPSPTISTVDKTQAPEPTATREIITRSGSSPDQTAVITVDNNPEFAKILAEPDYCSQSIESFARSYAGQKIEFDGFINAIPGPEDNSYPKIIGISPGDFDPNSAHGPTFIFKKIQSAESLRLDGSVTEEMVTVGQNLHFIATVGEYEPNMCLFNLEPVETSPRP